MGVFRKKGQDNNSTKRFKKSRSLRNSQELSHLLPKVTAVHLYKPDFSTHEVSSELHMPLIKLVFREKDSEILCKEGLSDLIITFLKSVGEWDENTHRFSTYSAGKDSKALEYNLEGPWKRQEGWESFKKFILILAETWSWDIEEVLTTDLALEGGNLVTELNTPPKGSHHI